MNYDFILLLAQQRTGTSAVSSIMSKHPELISTGQPFHIGHANKETSFFHFKEQMIRQDPSLCLPDSDADLLEKYIRQINQRYERTPFLDVKYNQTHFLNGVSYLPGQQPWIVRHALARKCPVIHLTRKNQLKVIVSELRANLTGIWHAKTRIEVENDAVEVDTGWLLDRLTTLEEVTFMFNSWVQNKPSSFTIDYDDLLTPDGSFSDKAAEGIEKITKLADLKTFTSDFIKTANNDLSKAIENYDDVVATLAGSPYEWMLD